MNLLQGVDRISKVIMVQRVAIVLVQKKEIANSSLKKKKMEEVKVVAEKIMMNQVKLKMIKMIQ